MIIDITEEEREFLERVCRRAEQFCKMNLQSPGVAFNNDVDKIKTLKEKLKVKEE